MTTTNHILHTARINNNCPLCYNTDGLEFTFSQNEKEGKYHKIADTVITEKLYCHTCKNIIYPVDWTEDIERVYQYNKKQVIAKSGFLELKPIAYILIILGIIIISSLIYFML